MLDFKFNVFSSPSVTSKFTHNCFSLSVDLLIVVSLFQDDKEKVEEVVKKEWRRNGNFLGICGSLLLCLCHCEDVICESCSFFLSGWSYLVSKWELQRRERKKNHNFINHMLKRGTQTHNSTNSLYYSNGKCVAVHLQFKEVIFYHFYNHLLCLESVYHLCFYAFSFDLSI